MKGQAEGGGDNETNEATSSPAGGRVLRSYMARKRAAKAYDERIIYPLRSVGHRSTRLN